MAKWTGVLTTCPLPKTHYRHDQAAMVIPGVGSSQKSQVYIAEVSLLYPFDTWCPRREGLPAQHTRRVCDSDKGQLHTGPYAWDTGR